MSNKKRIDISSTADKTGEKRLAEETSNPNWWQNLGILERFAVIGFALLLTAVVFGATGFPERIISRLTGQQASVSHNLSARGYQSSILANPVTTNTPQLSKEYLYAGGSGRLLAVEDAGANAAPPTDLAVWRPSDGTWYVLNSSNQQLTSLQWGTNSDVPVQGDYDGDGKTDFSVFRPSSNYWYVAYNAGGNTSFSFGTNGDKTAQADFDGDGKTDAAVYRPSTGYWYYFRSSDSVFTSVQFGNSTDKPMPKDYDGDGKADITIWRNSEAKYYVFRSSDASLQLAQIGQSGDVPVPADYDGDGRADFAVRSGANWIINQSSNNQTQTVLWQQAGDKEVPNDYDADGKVDIAVWRDATGMWYIRQSSRIGQSNELRQVQWGLSGDTPVPAYYRR